MTTSAKASAPLTCANLAEALSCFWNAALGARHNALDPVGCMAEGIQAVALRLQELDAAPAPAAEAPQLVEVGQIWRHRLTGSDFRITAAEPDDPTCGIMSVVDGSSTDLPCDKLREVYTLQPAEPKAPRYTVETGPRRGIDRDGKPLLAIHRANVDLLARPVMSVEEADALARRIAALLNQHGEG